MVILKFIFIFFLVIWLLSRIAGFLIRTFFGSLMNKQGGQTFTYTYKSGQKKPRDGNVSIDYDPKSNNNPGKKDSKFDAGDYVDYEEVK